MKQIEGMTQEQILNIIDDAVNKLAGKYSFGYYDIEDIKQEGRILGMACLEDYDNKRPLSNFIFCHIRNRLTNLIRDKFHRNDPPCKICHNAIEGATAHKDGKICEKYTKWKNLNNTKAGIVCPKDLQNIDDTCESNTRLPDDTGEAMSREELYSLIDLKLPSKYRADYLKMKEGLSVPKSRKDHIIKEIQSILMEHEVLDIIENPEF